MTWTKEGPQGNETGKVRFDLVEFMRGTVLDLGCGPYKIYPTAIGVDNNADAKLFGIHCNPDVRVASCERMPIFADHCADCVYSSHLLEHISDYQSALAEWWRLVKPGGYLILYLPHRELYPNIGTEGSNPDHKHDFLPDDITNAMEGVANLAGENWTQLRSERRAGGLEYSFLQIYRKHEEDKLLFRCVPYQQQPRPAKTLGIVRYGAYGDALWASALFGHFKREGWHITLYTQPQGELVLRHCPHLDKIVTQPLGLFAFPDGQVNAWTQAFWAHEARKFDKFINLVGAVERRLLPHPFDPDYYLPDEQRRHVMRGNYMEALHDWAGVPFERERPDRIEQRFYATAEELTWAARERASMDGPLVLINPTGSSMPKYWPYAQELAERLAYEGIYSLIVGDLRFRKFKNAGKFGRVIGMEWDLRRVFTLASLADVVVGTESALVNAVAYEDPLKLVLMSHSTHNNLTRDWKNTIALEPAGLPCYPCHRIHADFQHCMVEEKLGAALCQTAATDELVWRHIKTWLEREQHATA